MFDWMYLTNQSLYTILILVGLIVLMNILDVIFPNHFRKGFLPISTTRGERFFIVLLCSVSFWFLWFNFFNLPIAYSYIFVIPMDFIIMKWA